MRTLFTLSDSDIFPSTGLVPLVNFADRLAVKVILLDNENKLALVGTKHRLLPGGGVNVNEHDDDAAIREMREEVGCEIRIIREFAKTEEWRARIERHQYTRFLLAHVVGEKGTPETTQKDEQGIVVEWHSIVDAIALLEKQRSEIPFEEYNPCFNVRTHLAVLKELQQLGTLSEI